MGLSNAAFFSGFGFGPILGGLVTEHFNMNTAFLVMAGLNMFAFIVALVFLPKVQNRKQGEEFNLSYREMSGSGVVKGLFTIRVAEALGRGGMFTFLPIYGAAIGLSISLIGVIISVNTLSITLFSPLSGLAADRVNRRVLTTIGMGGFGLLILLLPQCSSFWQLLLLLLGQGLISSIFVASSNALVVDEGRRFGMGSTMSVLFLGMGIGMGIGPILAGWIEELASITAVFYSGGAVVIIGTALFIWFTRGYREKRTVIAEREPVKSY